MGIASSAATVLRSPAKMRSDTLAGNPSGNSAAVARPWRHAFASLFIALLLAGCGGTGAAPSSDSTKPSVGTVQTWPEPFGKPDVRTDAARLIRLFGCDPERHLAQLIDNICQGASAAASEAELMLLLRRVKAEAALLIASAHFLQQR